MAGSGATGAEEEQTEGDEEMVFAAGGHGINGSGKGVGERGNRAFLGRG